MENVLTQQGAVKAEEANQLRAEADQAANRGDWAAVIRAAGQAQQLEEEYCRNAIRWMQVRHRERYIWVPLKNQPQLVHTMLRMLKEAGEAELAGRVAREYGLEVELETPEAVPCQA